MARVSKKAQQRESILRHGFKLQRIFPKAAGMGQTSLCKAVHRLEVEAHRLAEDECSRPLPEGYVEKKGESILRRLDKVLGFRAAGVPVFLNGDSRGYALKIDAYYVRAHDLDIHTDWGGYGIIAPDF